MDHVPAGVSGQHRRVSLLRWSHKLDCNLSVGRDPRHAVWEIRALSKRERLADTAGQETTTFDPGVHQRRDERHDAEELRIRQNQDGGVVCVQLRAKEQAQRLRKRAGQVRDIRLYISLPSKHTQ